MKHALWAATLRGAKRKGRKKPAGPSHLLFRFTATTCGPVDLCAPRARGVVTPFKPCRRRRRRREGEQESRREGEKGSRGAGEQGRRGEGEKGRRGEGEKGRRGEGEKEREEERKQEGERERGSERHSRKERFPAGTSQLMSSFRLAVLPRSCQTPVPNPAACRLLLRFAVGNGEGGGFCHSDADKFSAEITACSGVFSGLRGLACAAAAPECGHKGLRVRACAITGRPTLADDLVDEHPQQHVVRTACHGNPVPSPEICEKMRVFFSQRSETLPRACTCCSKPRSGRLNIRLVARNVYGRSCHERLRWVPWPSFQPVFSFGRGLERKRDKDVKRMRKRSDLTAPNECKSVRSPTQLVTLSRGRGLRCLCGGLGGPLIQHSFGTRGPDREFFVCNHVQPLSSLRYRLRGRWGASRCHRARPGLICSFRGLGWAQGDFHLRHPDKAAGK